VNNKLAAAVERGELAQLTAQWGQFAVQHHRLDVGDPFLTSDGQLLVSDRRRAEICYVMHQGDPAAGVLLHIKTIYPTGAYRLPTGGIHQGQSVMDTLAREIEEETGLAVGPGSDQVQVQRLLGVLRYDLVHSGLQRTFPFATYAFLVQMPQGATLNPLDPDERICGWQWHPPSDLHQIADSLAGVSHQAPHWSDWGHYRSLIHRFVGERLGNRE
jgi:8-oxo-dGTP pyrophosphatase MutT (NUDIX family)